MIIVIKDGRLHGYKYTCPTCTSEYIATHNEEHRTSQGSIYTTCPICGKTLVWANTTCEIDCSNLLK